MNSDLIIRYFPGLSADQVNQYKLLGKLYPEWNSKINVISRKDIDNLYERHILYSLGIARVIEFTPGTKILDAGTGGGFPGIPLAIFFPEVHFHLIDSTAKKLTVVQNIAGETGLNNITTEHCRLEDHRGKYDFIVSRAVASLEGMVRWVWKNLKQEEINPIKNGILYLKGGDIDKELKGMEAGKRGGREAGKRGSGEAGKRGGMEAGKRGSGEALKYNIYQLSDFFSEPYFSTKSLIHLF